jgi:hypothetical protein
MPVVRPVSKVTVVRSTVSMMAGYRRKQSEKEP